jgi:predicted dehydrogenase
MILRFGVVGTGFWAREVHVPGLLRTAGAKVVGLWGRTPDRVEEIAKTYRIQAFSRLPDMLAEVDAVSIAVQPRAQPDIAVSAAQAGKHLILEKPLAMTVEEARAVEAAVKEARVASLVFFIRRFIPEIAVVIKAERRSRWERGSVRVHSPVMVTDSPYRDSRWRQEPGAALWDIGPHALSVLTPMLGEVSAIKAALRPNETVSIKTVHQNGGVADTSLSLHARPGEVSNDYRFTSPRRELLLPNPQVQRADVFSRAACELVAQVAAGERTSDCDVAFGAGIVDLLAQAQRTLDRQKSR